MKIRLNDSVINAHAKLAVQDDKRIELADELSAGLRIRIGKSKRVWVLLCRDANNRVCRFRVGMYPKMNLSEARIAAKRLREQVRDGHNPIADRRDARAQLMVAREAAKLAVLESVPVLRFRGLFDLYQQQGRSPGLANWDIEKNKLINMFASVIDQPASEVSLIAMQAIIDAKVRTAPKMALWAKRTILPMLKWAGAPGRKYCVAELQQISLPRISSVRDRVLSDPELQRILPVLLAGERYKSYNDCAMFILLTALRLNEAAKLRWDDIDWSAKTAKIVKTKNGKGHVVPLSRQAIALLERLRENPICEWVFPSENRTALHNWERWSKWTFDLTDTMGWTRHDLRRTCSTLLHQLGVLPHVAEAALGHTVVHSHINSVYNRYRYTPEVGVALQTLADHYDKLLATAVAVPMGAVSLPEATGVESGQ